MFEDKVLVCKDCGEEFVFTAGEQEFYAEKGLKNAPSRCKACRAKHKAERRSSERGERVEYDAICADCGASFKLRFVPKYDTPVYCDACYAKRRNS